MAAVPLSRARQCELLLEGLLAWVPGPKNARYSETGPGKPEEQAWKPCETCAERGRVNNAKKPCYQQGEHRYHDCKLCLVCNGTGTVRARGKSAGVDRYIDRAKAASLASTRTEKDAKNYATLLRLQDQAEGEHDQQTRLIDARDRMFKTGSFPELVRALEQLRDGNRNEQLAYSLLLRLRVNNEGREEKLGVWQPHPLESTPVVARALQVALAMVACRMPAKIIVPGWLLPVEAEKKTSLWRGRTNGHEEQRGDRDVSIVADLAAGVARASVAARWSLTPQRVSQIAAQPVATQP